MKSRLAVSETCLNFLQAMNYPRLWYLVKWEEKKIPPRFLVLLEKHAVKINWLTCSALKENSMWSSYFNGLLAYMPNLVRVNLAFCMVLYTMDWLQHCPNIKSLIVTSCPNMSSMSLVNNIGNLTKIENFECMNNGARIIALQIVEIASTCPSITHLNCYGTGNMRFSMAKEILESCTNMQVFSLSSNHIFDDFVDMMGWYNVTRRDFPAVVFSRNIKRKVQEYIDTVRSVNYQAWLDFQAQRQE